MMFDSIRTLDDFDFKGKKVLLRLDLNSPLDPDTKDFLDDRRFISHRDTILELLKKKAKIAILAHQGRPGDDDFVTLENHAKKLSEVIGHDVKYVDSIFGKGANDAVNALKPGEIIMLENTRFYSEEVLKRPADVQAKTIFVKKLAPLFDVFVNDAFAVAHRSQPSVVGFPMVMPAVAGRLMEKEVSTILGTLKKPKKPVTFILGGTKADDSIKVARQALEHNDCRILTGGVVGNIFLAAKGYRLGEPSIEFIRGKKMSDQIDVAKEILNKYGEKIVTPVDVALDRNNERVEIPVGDLPQNYRISDIGKETVKKYVDIINSSGTVFANGALGVFEDKNFAFGTESIIRAIADSKAFSVIGGGHTVAAARQLDVGDKIDHISSGGGACMDLLAGEKLPGIEALRKDK
ncbi:MAG: phosphoglycerate kinase [Candidatus Altiarchaeota archaeon]